MTPIRKSYSQTYVRRLDQESEFIRTLVYMRLLELVASASHAIVVCLLHRQGCLLDITWDVCIRVVIALPVTRKSLGIIQ